MADSLKSAAKKRKAEKGMSAGAKKRLAALENIPPVMANLPSGTTSNLQSAIEKISTPIPTSNGQSASVVGLPTYTGLSQVPHGLNFPTFEPNSYFATDLATDSSPLERVTKAEADAAVQSIEEKRQGLRIRSANIGLNTDVVKVGTEFRKFEGTVIDYAIAGVNNESKFINFETAKVNRSLAGNKFHQAHERLKQGTFTLQGMAELTALIPEEYEQRKLLKLSRIQDLKTAVFEASSRLGERLDAASEVMQSEMIIGD